MQELLVAVLMATGMRESKGSCKIQCCRSRGQERRQTGKRRGDMRELLAAVLTVRIVGQQRRRTVPVVPEKRFDTIANAPLQFYIISIVWLVLIIAIIHL